MTELKKIYTRFIMSQRIFSFWLLILFLFPHGLFSKSPTKQEFTYDSGNLNTKTDVDQTGIEDNSALHDSYRPRHKFKTESGSQSRFYRSEADSEKELEVKIPQCAVMYKNSEPVGILQPFEDSYRFLQVSGEPTLVDINPIPVKRKTIMDVLYPSKMVDDYDDQAVDNTAQFTDERYPSIFAKFKIDSRLDKSLNPDIHLKRSMHKRGSEKTNLNEQTAGSSKSALVKTKLDDGVAVEDELKNILDDMGLMEDYSDNNKEEAKREAEDENLELGTNKISLIKEERKEKRDKREDQNLGSTSVSITTVSCRSKKSISPLNTAVAAKDVQLEEISNEEEKGSHVEEERSVPLSHPNENSKLDEDSENVDLDVSTAKIAEQEESRKKRENAKDDKDSKRNAVSGPFQFTTSSLVKEAELSEYEKRVEREIRDKIEKLKNEVKKEISELKQTDHIKKEGFAKDTKRRKRQVVNTLLDEESVDINPLVSGDEKSQIHIRRKRNTLFEEPYTTIKDVPLENKNSSTTDKSLKEMPLVTERKINDDQKFRIKKFIGVSPILEGDNVTNYHIRTLKQYNENNSPTEKESEVHVRVKRQSVVGSSSKTNEEVTEKLVREGKRNARRKRETRDDLEEDAYQDDDPGFNDLSYENLKGSNPQIINENAEVDPAQLGRMEKSQFISDGGGCKCDKNSNGCKCGLPKVDLNIPNFKQEDFGSDSINLLEKKSVNQHCNCGKNDNHCKCGHSLDDLPSPFKRDYFSDNQQNVIDKNAVNEKDSSDELQADIQSSFPRRIRERRRNILNPVEKISYVSNEGQNRLNEEYEDYDINKNNLAKRDTRPRKFSANRPFRNGEYFVDLHPDIYRLSPAENPREKRDDFELVAMHGDNPIRKHLVAIKERSIIPHSRFRRRVQSDDEKQPRQLIDMSDEDLFGALPQSYAGELARYKRVKRTKTKK